MVKIFFKQFRDFKNVTLEEKLKLIPLNFSIAMILLILALLIQLFKPEIRNLLGIG